MDIKIGFVGLGTRGMSIFKDCVIPQAEVTAICDRCVDSLKEAEEAALAAGKQKPESYTDFYELLKDERVNTVIIATGWETHVEFATAAMEAGKAVAVEVSGSYDIDECKRLVDVYEKTGMPFMFLENCCFARREMMVLNMVEKGLFGEVVHCSGGYRHDLRESLVNCMDNKRYRLKHYMEHNCENYSTHEIGPIARILKINHGNRMESLVSVASKACGIYDFARKNKDKCAAIPDGSIKQGDIVTMVITCADGATITIELDTTLPRYYSRGFTVRGTNAMYEEYTDSVFVDGTGEEKYDHTWLSERSGNAKEFEEEWEHPVWKEYIKKGVQGTHEGMDWLMFSTFFECLKENKPMPIDVYDAATWMVITALSEESIKQGGTAVKFPDFTNGKWKITE